MSFKWVAIRITNYAFIYLDKNGNIINEKFRKSGEKARENKSKQYKTNTMKC